MQEGILNANYPKPNNAFTRFMDHSNPAVWVSEGQPTFWNRTFSGMLGRKGQASITFEIEKGLVKSPNGVKGFLFGKSQRVIEQNVTIPSNARMNIGRRFF